MASHVENRGLVARLPEVRGTLEPGANVSRFTWFKTGGPAEVLFVPADFDDLVTFLASCPIDIPVLTIGVGSNLLIRDGGIGGVVIRLGKPFMAVTTEGDLVSAGAGATDVSVAGKARDASLGGLEFLCGIPGTVGGAVRMNAGAYGAEVKDVLAGATIVERDGSFRDVPVDQLEFGYRHSGIADDAIVAAATFRGVPGDKAAIGARMHEIRASREESQPLRTRTGGSTFRNPPGEKAWALIDAAGCRGLRRGGAMVSDKHCNFLINTGEATAADIEGLGEEVRRRVQVETGVILEWEIRRIGLPEPGIEEISP